MIEFFLYSVYVLLQTLIFMIVNDEDDYGTIIGTMCFAPILTIVAILMFITTILIKCKELILKIKTLK